MVVEAARERDLHRYYQPWLDAQSLIDVADGRSKGLTYQGYQPQTSRDKALTAFAQLATLRLQVKRAMVSLIDSSRQYILAEATRTLSLFSHTADEGDEMWLGHAIISRADAVCHYTFGSTYSAADKNGESYVSNACIIPDCREDPRVCNRDYVTSEPGVRFYAGVPITTKAGFRIGVFAVSDDKPRDALKASEVRFMEDVAAAVMEHLELAKDSDDRHKGERMVRGLTDFIERSSMQEARNHSSNRAATLEKQTENARLQAIADEDPTEALPATSRQPHRKRDRERESDTSRIFQRAARIIRQSTGADGIIFFDTSAAHISSHPIDNYASPAASSDESHYSSTTAGSGHTLRKRKLEKGNPSGGEQASGNPQNPQGNPEPPATTDSTRCPVVGLSIRNGSMEVPGKEFIFTEASMERYIRRYPNGKFFNFDAEGAGINSSDERSEKSEAEQADKAASIDAPERKRGRRDRFVPVEFLRVLPSVRSLIFLPLWDPASERWTAGGFIWTMATGRLMNPDNELPYLKAFGNSITSEVARWHAQNSDRAKTTFIASISHELRSPLHGILGSVEFLRDTVSSAYQQSLVTSIETCGKTLLDTIDHVLDYSKINRLRGARRRHRGGRTQRLPADNSILGVTTVFNLAQLVEEVCDTVCTGYTFRKTHDIHNVTFHDQGSQSGANKVDGEGHDVHNSVLISESTKENVVVTLNVAPFVHWIVSSQPGALRRVVMNLLGNALKYTRSGFITVTLHQDKETSSEQAVAFTLTVEDSGRGMSTEHQNTRLFAPFSQEDPFSNGTGLGLSIVKQIVESLKGEIEVESTLNVGTKVSVHLKLPAGAVERSRTSQTLLELPKELKDTAASIIFPPTSLGGRGDKLRESMALGCRGFYMKTPEKLDLNMVDFLLTEPESLVGILEEQAKNALARRRPLGVICVCTDPTEKRATEAQISRDFTSVNWIVQVVAQPCGPRKLAEMLLDCHKRASGKVEALQVRSMNPSAARPVQEAPMSPKVLVQRSLSDLVRGHSAVPSSVQAAHSPLVSANMPLASSQQTSLSESRIQETPTTEDASEYFTPRMLLVDDNAINLKLLTVFAQRQKLRYETATNGLEAFEKYQREARTSNPPSKPFDFVLMDLSMPVMGGLESTRCIRKFESEHDIQRSTIIALTGLASAQDQSDAIDAGMDVYLVKPVKFGDIQRLFGANRGS